MFAQKHPKFAARAEALLTDVVHTKSSRSMSNLSSDKRGFLMMYVFEHFKLDMCQYGGKKTNGIFFTDIFWKEGCLVPEILASEVVQLIERGIMRATNEESRNMIFESTIVISNIPKGSSVDDVKRLLQTYQNEFYAERKGQANQARSVQLHFYSKARAIDALSTLRNTAHQFPDIQLVQHRKEIGTNSATTPA